MTHPNPAFGWADADELKAFASKVAFGQIAVVVDGRPLLAQAPITVADDGAVQFHLARSNAVTNHIDGAPIVIGLLADDFYVSPDWYGSADQVPTWNYRLVEMHGVARRLSDAELEAQVARLSVEQEERLLPKPVWTIDKLPPAKRAAMLRAIVGFAIDSPAWTGTAKLGQNKPAADRAAVAQALSGIGRSDLARLMEPRV
ncbi:FMN-binding negative transcriptional regulator [Sphingomonas nostoxanthinifaciens]|uniref:FMN-binding negative transcriptional regulator n=1 Tax=Sphingomonas nostoxanthinifaciens TaxID=2872652 RepID=UPI001CC215C9|nr:FMN-binding negative transcriptional regulator [Sphingomonas nostoxanthinifaciens]UAK26002.1 FMN-binding negative transcriptional regulator [Sphingomonas nostoxanthinifaciens]